VSTASDYHASRLIKSDPYNRVILENNLILRLPLSGRSTSVKPHQNRGTPPTKPTPIPSNHNHHGRAEPSPYLCLDDLAVLAEGALERALRGVPRQPADEDPPHLVLRHLGAKSIGATCTAGKSHQENRDSAAIRATEQRESRPDERRREGVAAHLVRRPRVARIEARGG